MKFLGGFLVPITEILARQRNLTVINYMEVVLKIGEQGWCSGERARLPPMCPGFDSRTRASYVG